MDRETFIKEIRIIEKLLGKLKESTTQKIEENRKVRKLLKLPSTVHNQTSLKNYLNSTNKSASK
tara:strand:+ start:604 stop:795 length:192 start_codon:yes stop_codon:yes gene_type:complete